MKPAVKPRKAFPGIVASKVKPDTTTPVLVKRPAMGQYNRPLLQSYKSLPLKAPKLKRQGA